MRNILACIITICFLQVRSQTVKYHSRFGTDGDDIGIAVKQTLDKGYLIVGRTTGLGAMQTDILITKVDSMSQIKFIKKLGGAFSDVATSFVVLQDSSFVLIGYSNSFGNGGYDAYIARVDKTGELIWQKSFGGTDWDFGKCIGLTNDGNLIACGTSYNFGRPGKNAFILKLDFNGNFIWSKIYGGILDDEINQIIPTIDGGYMGIGTTKSYGDITGDIWFTKLNSLGDSTKFSVHGGVKKDVGNSLFQSSNGDYFITGGSENYTNGKEDAYVAKFDQNLSLIWQRNYGEANADEEALTIIPSSLQAGGMVICYTTNEMPAFKLDTKTLLLDAIGYYSNGGRVGSTEFEEAYNVTNCKDGGYMTVGYTDGFGATSKDIFLVKFDSLMNGPGNLILKTKNEIAENNLGVSVYPIPTNSELFIKCEKNLIIKSVKIYDSFGKTILTLNSEKNKETIDLQSLPDGIYFLSVLDEKNRLSVKKVCLKR